MTSEPANPGAVPTPRRKYFRTVSPGLNILLYVLFALLAVLGINSVYLAGVTFWEWLHPGLSFQNFFYQYMFLAHLVLGLALLPPLAWFIWAHWQAAIPHPNRRAFRVGLGLLSIVVVLMVSGIALMRVGGFEIRAPAMRSLMYWAHVITPLGAAWFYVLHRLAGPRIKWRAGIGWIGAASAFAVGMVWMHAQDPRRWNAVGPKEGEKYFKPSLARTATGGFVPAKALMMDDYCKKCHADAYEGWFHSSHRFSSFNNKPYLFSVRETRQVSMQRDGTVKAARWCAGCHDPVPFYSGAFDDPNFDLEKDPTSQAGITCTVCHSITHINSTRGNADYTIEEPIHYPFAYSSNRALQFINETLVKAKPEFHKKTFLKPLHKTAEYCSACHKVSLPQELTQYKEFLRGQNHYDTFLLSGASGHGARSFYYPPHAQENCAGCHMPLQVSKDFGAKLFNPTNQSLSIHSHMFPSANTGLAHLRGDEKAVEQHKDFLKGSVRVDIFGVREGGEIDGPLIAPLRPKVPALKPGSTYLLEVVLRTLKLGHPLTQGTVDSNELWVDAKVHDGQRTLGKSGGLGPYGEVDEWAHFVNVYMLDRNGNRVDRRNAQDIFTPLYNHQIPPGAAQVGHFLLTVPPDQTAPVTVEVKLQYRKFDTIYMNYVYGKNWTNGQPFQVSNSLPIVTMASDRLVFPVEGGTSVDVPTNAIPVWQRWNDYGIGLLLEGDKGSEKGELVQAEQAFTQVEKLGRADGPLNLARVYYKEGRLDDTVGALQRAVKFDPPAPRWTVAWLNGLVNKQNGYLDRAIEEFTGIIEDRYPELDQRGFDFSKDYEVINELGQTLFERAKRARGTPLQFQDYLRQADKRFHDTLALDSENLTAYYNLSLIYAELGDEKMAAQHRALHERYRLDDNVRDRAVVIARRRNPAADRATQALIIYDLGRSARAEQSQQRMETQEATRH